MNLFGAVVRMPAVASWSMISNLHGLRPPTVLVALLAEMRFPTAKKGSNVAAKEALECNVLIAVRLAIGGEILVAVQTVDALPSFFRFSLVICRGALDLAGIASFVAIAVGNRVR